MNNRNISLIVLIILVSFIFMGAASAANTDKNVNLNDKRFSTVNLPFVENNGQITDKSVKYSANTFIGNVYVKNNGIVYSLTKDKKGWIVTESFLNANDVAVKGVNPTKTKVNYYKGKNVQENLQTFSMVKYSNLYTGVNLYLKAHGKNIEKIYAVSSTGTPSSIWVTVKGAKGLKINQKGELVILNGSSALKLTKPVAYQIINGKKVNVSVSYLIKNSSYGYKTGAYNKNYKLIIDPLLSSTFLGGNSYDAANAIAVDRAGNVYVTGYTGSNDFASPITTGTFNGGPSTAEWDVFVSKFSSDLSTLFESTYIGGSLSDQAKGIALDNNGQVGCNVFITGVTYSHDYPKGLIPGYTVPWDTGAGDVFISKLTNNLALTTSAIIGGNHSDIAYGILVDASNNVYITGQTFSFNDTENGITGFPVRYSQFNEPTPKNTYVGNGDIFVTKFNNALTELTSGVVFGGTGTSYGTALAVDQQNYIYVTGATNAANFPAVTNTNIYPNNGFQTNKGEYDAFVVKLSNQYLENIEGVALLGGSARDIGNAIAVDPLGRVFIGGGTWSTNMYTTLGAKQRQNNGKEDGFITVFDKQIQNVLSSTYLGGNGIDVVNGIVVSDQGNIGIVGTTNSTTNFLNEKETGDTTPQGMEDVFLTIFTNPMSAQEKVETTFLGGTNADYGQGIALDTHGNVYLAGNTWSNDYPTTNGAQYPTAPDLLQYTEDAFVSKMDNLFDTEPPIVGPTDPTKNAVNVQLNKIIKITFNELIQPGIDYGLITLQHEGVNTPVSKNIVGNTLIITPLTNLLANTNYILNLPVAAIQDLNGNIGDEFALSFKTFVPLTIVSTNPVNTATNVVGNTPIKITFNKSIKTGPNYNLINLKNSSLVTIPITKTISGNILTITPKVNLSVGTYTLTLPINSVLDISNTGLSSIYTTSFTVTSPTVTSTNPVNNAINFPINQVISVTFDRAIQNPSSSLIKLIRPFTGEEVPITFEIKANDNKTLIIHYATYLLKNINYSLTLNPNCITDMAGNGLETQKVIQFKTGSTTTSAFSKTPVNTAPTVISSNPVNNAVNIPTNKVIKINFSEAIKFGTNVWIELKSSSGKAIPFTKTISGSTLSITPTTTLAKGTTYTVIIHTNSITDLTGKGLATVYTTKFKTAI